MKPFSRKVMPSRSLLQDIGFGSSNTVASIKGSVKKLGAKYQNATVVVYNKANLLPIAIRKPDADGNYQVLGLNTDLKMFIVAFDKNQQFNAVIQDNVVPK
ncbi:hypothetical protein [Acinetobacter radioresistens]|uniref:hypothetical protein n=1 Tax=Acinetobacter radioresistens TaxID=40216 RepID=UPI000DAF1BCC|nr:hypothetical protein [Acinetobacter radioresistens]AWV86212.1 hypothetical protein DOM24_06320 [Acinetobacter radioresistens]MCX0327648.1 hypothetical protein [Acinetobacter radioresistens]